jgi:hypothetical protein
MAEATPVAGVSIHVTLDADLAERLARFRRSQDRIPTVSQSVRHLLARALADHNHAAA